MKKISYDKIDDALYVKLGKAGLKSQNEKSEGYCFINYQYYDSHLIEIRILDASKFFDQGFLNLLKKTSIGSLIFGIYEVNFSDSLKEKMIDEIEKRYSEMDPDIKKEFEKLESNIKDIN